MSMNVKKEIEGLFSKIEFSKAKTHGYLIIPGSEEIEKYIRSLTKSIPGGPLLKFMVDIPAINVLKIGKGPSICVYTVNTEYHAEDVDRYRINLICNIGPSLNAKFIDEDDLKDDVVMDFIRNSKTSNVIIVRFPYDNEDILKNGVRAYSNIVNKLYSLFKNDIGFIQKLTGLNNNFATMCENARNEGKSISNDPVFYMKGFRGLGYGHTDKCDTIIKRMGDEWTGDALSKSYIGIGFIPLFKKNEVYLDDSTAKNIDKNIIYDKNNKDVDDIVKGLYVCMNLNRFFDNVNNRYSECSKTLEETWTDLISMNEFDVRMLFFDKGSQLFDILCPFIITFDKFKSFYEDKIKDISELILIGYDCSMHAKVKAAENIFDTYKDTFVEAASHYWDVDTSVTFKRETPEYIDRDDMNGVNRMRENGTSDGCDLFRSFTNKLASTPKSIEDKQKGFKRAMEEQRFGWRYGKIEINPIDIRFYFDNEVDIVNREISVENAFMGKNSSIRRNSSIIFRKNKDSYDTVIDYFDINKIMFAKFKTVQTHFVKYMSRHIFNIKSSFIFVLNQDNYVEDIIIRIDNCRWRSPEDDCIEFSFKSTNFDKDPFLAIANDIIDLHSINIKDEENIKIKSAGTMISKLDVNSDLDTILISADDISLLGIDIVNFPINVHLVRNSEFKQRINIEMPLLYADQESGKLAPCKYTMYSKEKEEDVYGVCLHDILRVMDISRIASIINDMLGFGSMFGSHFISTTPTISLSYGPSVIVDNISYSKRFKLNNNEDLIKFVMEVLQIDGYSKEYTNAYNVELHKASVSMKVVPHRLLDTYEI